MSSAPASKSSSGPAHKAPVIKQRKHELLVAQSLNRTNEEKLGAMDAKLELLIDSVQEQEREAPMCSEVASVDFDVRIYRHTSAVFSVRRTATTAMQKLFNVGERLVSGMFQLQSAGLGFAADALGFIPGGETLGADRCAEGLKEAQKLLDSKVESTKTAIRQTTAAVKNYFEEFHTLRAIKCAMTNPAVPLEKKIWVKGDQVMDLPQDQRPAWMSGMPIVYQSKVHRFNLEETLNYTFVPASGTLDETIGLKLLPRNVVSSRVTETTKYVDLSLFYELCSKFWNGVWREEIFKAASNYVNTVSSIDIPAAAVHVRADTLEYFIDWVSMQRQARHQIAGPSTEWCGTAFWKQADFRSGPFVREDTESQPSGSADTRGVSSSTACPKSKQ